MVNKFFTPCLETKDEVNNRLLNDLEDATPGLFASNDSIDDTTPRILSSLSYNYQSVTASKFECV